MSVPAYPAYKDSGVEWLGEVPAHWGVGALKRPFAIIGGTTPKADNPEFWDGGIPWATPTDLGSSGSVTIFETGRTISEAGLASCGTTMVPAGSVILSTRAPIGSLGIAGVPLCTNQGCKSLVPLGDDCPSFFAHLLSVSTAELNIRGSGSTFLELSGDKLGAFQVPVPPPVEQAAIAAFLDRETGKIDALVEEQRRLIALLKEKRQAVISHAVTKGLNPQAPMKPSGIEWLGDIPAHWEVKPIGHLCLEISYGFTNPMPSADEGPYLLTANDIDHGFVRFDTARRTTAEAFNGLLTEKSRPKKGDVLLTKDGTLGRIAVHDGTPACINQSVAYLRPDQASVSSEFLACSLSDGVYQDRMIYEAGGSTIKHIYISRLAKMALAVPPRTEMLQVQAFCQRAGAAARELVDAAQMGIELLQERRAALISAAVTGKIDVRGLVAAQRAQEAA